MSIFKKKPEKIPDGCIPVIRCSICTGEKVAGFKNTTTGKISEIMLIEDDFDLRKFRERYGIEDNEKIEKVY